MLPVTLHTFVLWLHILAASVWIGGQITVVTLSSRFRTLTGDRTFSVGWTFNKIAWPALAVLLLTGTLNILYLRFPVFDVAFWSTPVGVTLLVKLTLVAISVVAALIHIFHQRRLRLTSNSPPRGIRTALGLLTMIPAFGVAFFGAVLHAG